MVQRVIFPKEDGGVSVLILHNMRGEPLNGGMSIEEAARREVPPLRLPDDEDGSEVYERRPFRIVDEHDIPQDRSERDLWTADFSQPDGYGIGRLWWDGEQAARGESQ